MPEKSTTTTTANPKVPKEKKLTKAQEEFVAELESLGDTRKAIYEFLLTNGFELTEDRHKQLKKLINTAAHVEVERLTKEKALLASKLEQKFIISASEVLAELKKVNYQKFKGLFKQKHQAVLQVVITRLHKYLEAGKDNEDAGSI